MSRGERRARRVASSPLARSTSSRRELLALIAGAPLAAAACRARREVAGELRGASVDVGHRLRSATLEQARGEPQRVGVAVIGAGPSGLSAAWWLERHDERDFVVFDLERQAGGTSAYGTDGAVPYPWGAHYVPAPARDQRALVRLLDEMGALVAGDHAGRVIPREDLLVREPEERLFVAGKWREGLFPHAIATDADHAELARFQAEVDRWVRFRDAQGRRAFALPLRRSSDAAEVTALDRQSASDWLDALGVRSPVVRWWIEYATRDDYGLELGSTSAWALLFYFASRVLVPGEESAPFIAWPEGNGRVVRHLGGVVGDRLRLGRLVTDVVPRDDGVDLAVADVAAGTVQAWRADQVIVALPKFVAARVLRPWRDAPPAYVRDFTYGSWLVANLHVSRRPESRGVPFAWDSVLYDSPALGYVNAMHQRGADRGPAVLTYYWPLCDADPARARQRLLELDHASASALVMADLSRAHPDLSDVVTRLDVWRWGHAMVRPTPGFIWGDARRRAAEPLGRVHLAHSDLSGLALLEEAQDRGITAANAVLAQRGKAPEAP